MNETKFKEDISIENIIKQLYSYDDNNASIILPFLSDISDELAEYLIKKNPWNLRFLPYQKESWKELAFSDDKEEGLNSLCYIIDPTEDMKNKYFKKMSNFDKEKYLNFPFKPGDKVLQKKTNKIGKVVFSNFLTSEIDIIFSNEGLITDEPIKNYVKLDEDVEKLFSI